MELVRVIWGDVVVFDVCVECCVKLVCFDDGDVVIEGFVILLKVNKELLELFFGEGEGFIFLVLSLSCSMFLLVFVVVLLVLVKFWFLVGFLLLEMFVFVLLIVGVFFFKRKEVILVF